MPRNSAFYWGRVFFVFLSELSDLSNLSNLSGRRSDRKKTTALFNNRDALSLCFVNNWFSIKNDRFYLFFNQKSKIFQKNNQNFQYDVCNHAKVVVMYWYSGILNTISSTPWSGFPVAVFFRKQPGNSLCGGELDQAGAGLFRRYSVMEKGF